MEVIFAGNCPGLWGSSLTDLKYRSRSSTHVPGQGNSHLGGMPACKDIDMSGSLLLWILIISQWVLTLEAPCKLQTYR
jgi:hypothetical protein